ncbi:hypothetical protein LGQ02_08870 [Bacillus shivajii]|uniref:hypothetical protein n=1 Tax=Bacillus shivajii TaxID=1983719 RepID=UPI001CFBFA00|nr:hypothetical protein [Bacillus shivajii]UCZ54839.1 hypothetical protein LGQ02_08870 [Bacillus shivajii]
MLLIQQSTGQARLTYYFFFLLSKLSLNKNDFFNQKTQEAKDELSELKRAHRI